MENSSELLLLLYHSMVRVTYPASYYSDEVVSRDDAADSNGDAHDLVMK
jgi:hypothetical protein